MLSLIACIDILFLQRLSHSSDYEGMKCDTGSQTQEMAENLFTTEFDDDEFKARAISRKVPELEKIANALRAMARDEKSGLSINQIGAFMIQAVDPNVNLEDLDGYKKVKPYLK